MWLWWYEFSRQTQGFVSEQLGGYNKPNSWRFRVLSVLSSFLRWLCAHHPLPLPLPKPLRVIGLSAARSAMQAVSVEEFMLCLKVFHHLFVLQCCLFFIFEYTSIYNKKIDINQYIVSYRSLWLFFQVPLSPPQLVVMVETLHLLSSSSFAPWILPMHRTPRWRSRRLTRPKTSCFGKSFFWEEDVNTWHTII